MSKLTLLVIYVAAGVLMIALAIPLILRRIPPNRWYGFRTPRTVADPEVWYPANVDAGQRMAAAGLTIIVGAIGFYFVPRWSMTNYAFALLAVTLFSLGYGMLQSFRNLRSIRPPQEEKSESGEES
jgi:uncharacterized membrane protein